jgi:RimJ/RimL family protein N-acetyltransferase
MWAGRAEAWAFIAGDVPRRAWPALHRAVMRTLDSVAAELGLRRIEASCAHGWPPGRRWLLLLGFEEEGLARCYAPDGRDFWRFARITA